MTDEMRAVAMVATIASVFGLAVVSAGCGSRCTEGRSAECRCPDGTTGSQTCRADGTWGECRCLGPDRDAATTADGADSSGGFPDTAEVGVADSSRGGTDGAEWDAGGTVDGDVGADTGEDPPPEGGWRSVRARSRFAHDVSPPACDPSSSSVKIIDDDGDWEAIDNDEYDTFCVQPGDYREVADRIRLSASGSDGDRRYIVYDGPTDAHPIEQSADERAIVDGFRLESGADYWTISGLTVDSRDDQRARNAVLTVDSGATHNVFDRMLVSGPEGEYVNRLMTKIRGDHTTVQNSVMRNTRNPDSDRNCIDVIGDRVVGTRVVSNELYDCTDSVQLVISSGVGLREYPGALVAHNDMYHSRAFRTDGNGNFDEDGDWTCGENAVDIKGTGTEEEPIRVIGNRMWGHSDTDEDCGGSGSGPFSKAIVVHQAGDAERGPNWVEIRNNVIFDTASAIALAETRHIEVTNNLFHSYGYRDGNGNQGYGVMPYITYDTEISGNVFTGGRFWTRVYNDSTVELRDNALVDAGESGAGSGSPSVEAGGNAYYGDSTPWEDDPAVQHDDVGASNNDPHCVTLKGYTSPTERCFDHAVSTSDSPHGTEVGFQIPDSGN